MNTYFITGATGVVGSALCEELLTRSADRLILLVRADSSASLARRADELCAYWGLAKNALGDRVRWVRGDTTEPRFGLDAPSYAETQRDTTHLIHCAGAVRMNLPIEAARASAVGGANAVLEFAREAQALRKIEFVSTVGVAGRTPGTLAEEWTRAPNGYHNTYEQAKAEAEVLLQAAIARGLPATVHRPSMVVGEAKTGKIIHFQVFYHLAEFLCGTRTRGLFPDTGATQLDLIPSDYVARALIWSSGTTATSGRILHLCSGPQDALLMSEVRSAIQARFRAAGIPVKSGLTLPAGVFRAAARALASVAPPQQRRALLALPAFLDYLKEAQTFANEKTKPLLAQAGIAAPPMREFMAPVLDYYLARRAARPARDEG